MPKGEKVNNTVWGRCTKAVKEERIDQGAQWMLENPDAKWTDFIKWAEAQWNIQKSSANIYYRESTERLGKVDGNVEAARKLAELSLKNMLRAAMSGDKPDHKLALSIRQEINKIAGLYTQKIQVEDVSEKPIFQMSPIKASEQDKQD